MSRCDFATLERGDYNSVAVKFPEQALRIQALAHSRIAKDALRAHMKQCDLFKGLSQALRDALIAEFRAQHWSRGETIFQ